MGFSAAALAKRFLIFSLAMAATALTFGPAAARMSSDIAEGDPTQWMGVVERVSYGAWLLWMAVLAIVLLRRELMLERRPRDGRLRGP